MTKPRLIDANAFKERMMKTNRYFTIKFDIDEEPTAYNLDAVMKRLEAELYNTLNPTQIAFDLGIRTAIEIVKKGGVE